MARKPFQHTVANTATKFLDTNLDRTAIHIRNTGGATVYVGNKEVGTGTGFAILANGVLDLYKALGDDTTNEMYSISAAGGETLTVLESFEG